MSFDAVSFDAVILAGGRGNRLGGLSKPTMLVRDGETLLEIAIRAASGARRTVVVGDVPAPDDVLLARENPPFSGPVAALAAGLRELADDAAPFTLVLAADQPDVGYAVDVLHRTIAATERGYRDGAIAVDASGRDQYLICIYATTALQERLSARTDGTDAADFSAGMSMRSITAGLDLARVAVPAGSADDVDTWNDAERLGVELVTTKAEAPA